MGIFFLSSWIIFAVATLVANEIATTVPIGSEVQLTTTPHVDSGIAPATPMTNQDSIRVRLIVTLLLGSGALGLLGVLFSYLKMNLATRGFYNRRLQTIAIIVSLAILAGIGFAFYWIVG